MIEEGTAIKKIHNKYNIANLGPSNVDQMIVTILIPTSFIINSNLTVNLVNSSDVTFLDAFLYNITINNNEKTDPDLITKTETPDFTKMHITNTVIQSVNSLSPNKTVFMDCSYPQDHFKCDEFSFFLINSLSKYDNYEFTVEYYLNMSHFGKTIKL